MQPDVFSPDDDADDECDMWLVVVRALRSVFPLIDVEEINRFEPLQDEIDMTALDFTHLMASVTEQTGLVVPERDYPHVGDLDSLERYLASQLSTPTS